MYRLPSPLRSDDQWPQTGLYICEVIGAVVVARCIGLRLSFPKIVQVVTG